MRLDRFDLNLLVVLQALLEERNVTRASKRLHIGQSAASGALGRLREHFDDELLIAMGRTMVLTPLARRLVEPVNQTLSIARSTIGKRAVFDPASTECRISVAASDYVSTVLLSQVIGRLAALAPKIFIDLRGPMQDVFEQFGQGRIDLMILPQQYVTTTDCVKQTLFEDTFACIVWDKNTHVEDTLMFEKYMSLGHVTVNFSDERTLAFEEWFAPRYGIQRKVELSVDSFGLLPLVIIGTERVATLHRKQAEHFAKIYPLRIFDAPFTMPPVVETMCWPHHVNGDPAQQWVRQVVIECAAQL